MATKPVAPENACGSMYRAPLGSVIDVSSGVSMKADPPIVVREPVAGKEMEVSCDMSWKAYSPIVASELGKVIEVTPELC